MAGDWRIALSIRCLVSQIESYLIPRAYPSHSAEPIPSISVSARLDPSIIPALTGGWTRNDKRRGVNICARGRRSLGRETYAHSSADVAQAAALHLLAAILAFPERNQNLDLGPCAHTDGADDEDEGASVHTHRAPRLVSPAGLNVPWAFGVLNSEGGSAGSGGPRRRTRRAGAGIQRRHVGTRGSGFGRRALRSALLGRPLPRTRSKRTAEGLGRNGHQRRRRRRESRAPRGALAACECALGSLVCGVTGHATGAEGSPGKQAPRRCRGRGRGLGRPVVIAGCDRRWAVEARLPGAVVVLGSRRESDGVDGAGEEWVLRLRLRMLRLEI
ncbi:hypothetical protein DENSPDRAFT_897013 [Dentipellis sp. KUC8613]|nr:hypothetical protein DENSPDRAFT_897013 [Dentipellis sp. KUC8613]